MMIIITIIIILTLTDYGPWLLQWYWYSVKKCYELITANFYVHRNDSQFVVWVTDEIQTVQDRLSCMKLVRPRYVSLRIATCLIREKSSWF